MCEFHAGGVRFCVSKREPLWSMTVALMPSCAAVRAAVRFVIAAMVFHVSVFVFPGVKRVAHVHGGGCRAAVDEHAACVMLALGCGCSAGAAYLVFHRTFLMRGMMSG